MTPSLSLPGMGEITKSVEEIHKKRFDIVSKKYQFKFDIEILFLKIGIKTVINRDFSKSNSLFHIIFPKHNLDFPPVSLRNTQFHIIFPKHNLDFPLVSLSSTWFHIVFPNT